MFADASFPTDLDQSHRNTIREAVKSIEEKIHLINEVLAPRNESAEQFIRSIAFRLLQTAPVVVLITELDGRVKWCNRTCEQLVGEPVSTLAGKTIEAVQKLREMKDLQTWHGGKWTTIESFEVNGVPKRFLVHRFIFSTPIEACIGSLAFSVDELEAARRGDVVLQSLPYTEVNTVPSLEIVEILAAFMEHLPTAAAVRDRELRALWCNRKYMLVAGDNAGILGKHLRDTFPVLNTSTVARMDQRILNEGKALLTAVEVSESVVRTTLRFPIFDITGQILYIAGIGSNTETIPAQTGRTDDAGQPPQTR